MVYTLGLDILPFKQETYQIIYTEGQYNEVVNNFIRRNFSKISAHFKSRGYEFCYIPYLKYDLARGERQHYNAPYAKAADLKFMSDDNFILEYMVHPENREKVPPSLLFYHPSCWNSSFDEAESQFQGVPITEKSFEGDEELKGVLDEIIGFVDDHMGPRIMFQKVPSSHSDIEDYHMAAECLSSPADEEFDVEAKQLIDEIRERIEKLEQKGIESEMIERLFHHHKRKLSRLHITEDYRIFLVDYMGMEIKMTPLPKAVFLLFLKHPEGIMFSYLPDYRDELLEIYSKVKGPFFNVMTAKKSIDDVTDSTGNSINEKCSRIREAFVSQFDDHLARNYYITGKRGEAKRITLPREMVKWDK